MILKKFHFKLPVNFGSSGLLLNTYSVNKVSSGQRYLYNKPTIISFYAYLFFFLINTSENLMLTCFHTGSDFIVFI